jgi:hypothetical protein
MTSCHDPTGSVVLSSRVPHINFSNKTLSYTIYIILITCMYNTRVHIYNINDLPYIDFTSCASQCHIVNPLKSFSGIHASTKPHPHMPEVRLQTRSGQSQVLTAPCASPAARVARCQSATRVRCALGTIHAPRQSSFAATTTHQQIKTPASKQTTRAQSLIIEFSRVIIT